MSNHLSQELVEQILLKLPVKSLLRFRPVSKKWCQLITTLMSYTNRTLFLLARYTRINQFVFWVDNDGTFQEYAMYEPRKEDGFEGKVVLHCCANGLICFSDYERVVLWDPATRRSIRLPESNVRLNKDEKYVFGIVVDHITNQYKILRTDNSGELMEIYRQSTGLWEPIISDTFYEIYGYQVDVQGISYWIATSYDRPILVSFDGDKELFGSIEIPVPSPVTFHGAAFGDSCWSECGFYLFKFEEQEHNVDNGQFVCKESIVFIHSDAEDDEDNGQFKFTYKIWKIQVSEGNSCNLWLWSKICFNKRVKPIGFRKNGELLWVGKCCYVYVTLELGFTKRLISVNLGKGSKFCMDRRYHPNRVCAFPNYVKSHALLEEPEKE